MRFGELFSRAYSTEINTFHAAFDGHRLCLYFLPFRCGVLETVHDLIQTFTALDHAPSYIYSSDNFRMFENAFRMRSREPQLLAKQEIIIVLIWKLISHFNFQNENVHRYPKVHIIALGTQNPCSWQWINRRHYHVFIFWKGIPWNIPLFGRYD